MFVPPPSRREMMKVLTEGTKTMVMPDRTPERLSGKNDFQKYPDGIGS
jgi:hypothetical protein